MGENASPLISSSSFCMRGRDHPPSRLRRHAIALWASGLWSSSVVPPVSAPTACLSSRCARRACSIAWQMRFFSAATASLDARRSVAALASCLASRCRCHVESWFGFEAQVDEIFTVLAPLLSMSMRTSSSVCAPLTLPGAWHGPAMARVSSSLLASSTLESMPLLDVDPTARIRTACQCSDLVCIQARSPTAHDEPSCGFPSRLFCSASPPVFAARSLEVM